jgi:phosphohistidine swiveling domain-containing protein
VLRHARARVRDRENLRFERTRLFGRVRRIYLELGKRLHAVGRLAEPRDIFFLTVEEALGFVEGTTATTDLAGLVALRQREFAGFRAKPAPADRFATRGAVHLGNTFRAAQEAVAPTGDTLKGIGCCPGVVRARARVITDPRNATIESGEILVAPRTDPGWIMLFPAAAGLLVEYGSLLSHSAIVAREMGIPAIVSISGLTSWVRTGDWLEMDGSTGVVRKCAEGSVA